MKVQLRRLRVLLREMFLLEAEVPYRWEGPRAPMTHLRPPSGEEMTWEEVKKHFPEAVKTIEDFNHKTFKGHQLGSKGSMGPATKNWHLEFYRGSADYMDATGDYLAIYPWAKTPVKGPDYEYSFGDKRVKVEGEEQSDEGDSDPNHRTLTPAEVVEQFPEAASEWKDEIENAILDTRRNVMWREIQAEFHTITGANLNTVLGCLEATDECYVNVHGELRVVPNLYLGEFMGFENGGPTFVWDAATKRWQF